MIHRSCPFWLAEAVLHRPWPKTVPRDLLSISFDALCVGARLGELGELGRAGRAGRAGTIPWGVSMCPLMRWASCSLRVPHFRSRTMVASRWKPCHVIHVIHMAPPFPSPPSCCMKRGRCNSSCGSWSSSRSSFNRSSWTCCRSLTSYKLRMRSMEDLRVVAAMDSINFRSRHSMGCNMDQDAPCIAQTNGPWRQRSKRLATRRAASSHFRLHLGLGTCGGAKILSSQQNLRILSIFEQGQEDRHGWTMVNHPLQFTWERTEISVFQSFHLCILFNGCMHRQHIGPCSCGHRASQIEFQTHRPRAAMKKERGVAPVDWSCNCARTCFAMIPEATKG